LTNVAPASGGSATYSFVATHPGTFVYESGTNPDVQVPMGLFGALVVRPAAGQVLCLQRFCAAGGAEQRVQPWQA